ncbi:MAG: L7Ae/L30e/S12e/Gadd45 family ribosomal protein [Bacillota bacterium]|jgi:large subunit ribosomal protein L7A
MNLDALKDSKKVVGTKQTLKAVQKNIAVKVFVAEDAETRVLMPLFELCSEKNIEVIKVESMAELGKACGIDVGTASAAIVQ